MRESHKLIAGRVGVRLKQARGKMTQKEFASVLGIKQSQYSRYETGERLVPDSVLERAARNKGIAPDELVWTGVAPTLPTATPVEAVSEHTLAVAELIRLLDDEAKEDLHLYLEAKVKGMARRRRRDLKQAQKALDTLRRKVG